MKRPLGILGLVLFALLASLLSAMRLSSSGDSQYQYWLLTSHSPHVLAEIESKYSYFKNEGRIKLLRLKKSNPPNHKHLKKVSLSEVNQYIYKPKKVLLADPSVEAITQEVSRISFQNWLEFLASFENRSVSGLDNKTQSGNRRAVEWLKSEFGALGYQTNLHCYKKRKQDDECNVVATKKGTQLADEKVVVVGHLDDVGHHQAGADDNASGAVALLEMARVLSGRNSKRSIVFLATNGEEVGLDGSRAFVKKYANAGDLKELYFSINMDMIAYNKNGTIDIETNKAFENEAKWYAQQVKNYTSLTPNITMPAWGSDHVPFLDHGIPAILTIEHWKTKTPCYHKSCDKLDTIHYDYALEIVRLNLAVVAQKAEIEF